MTISVHATRVHWIALRSVTVLFGSLPASYYRILSICSIALRLPTSADAASPCSMYSLILNHFLKPSNQPFENRGFSLPLYCGRPSHNLPAWFRRISPIITAFCFWICCCHSNNAPSRLASLLQMFSSLLAVICLSSCRRNRGATQA